MQCLENQKKLERAAARLCGVMLDRLQIAQINMPWNKIISMKLLRLAQVVIR